MISEKMTPVVINACKQEAEQIYGLSFLYRSIQISINTYSILHNENYCIKYTRPS